jgi:hypothetical protein
MSALHPADFNEDKLDLRGFSEKLEKYLLVDHDFIEGSLVVSLNAPFGSGKSTFLTMWKSDLEKRRGTDPTQPLVITLNAWESDYCGDPLLSVISGLIQALEPISERAGAAEALREAAKDVWWFGVGLANSLVEKSVGVDIVKAGDLAEKKKTEREPKKTDHIIAYEERVGSLKRLKDVLRSSFEGSFPAFIFVDELDRCRPDYAIQYLETIKHVFDIHGLIFVLAVDYDQLSNSAKALFGARLNFEEYFRKFAHRSFSFPELSIVAYQNICQSYVSLFLQAEGKRDCIINLGHHDRHLSEIVAGFRLTLRQVQEVFRILGHVLSCEPSIKGKGHAFIGIGAFLLAVLKISNRELYELLGYQKNVLVEIVKEIVKALGPEKARWWCGVFLSGYSTSEKIDADNIKKLYIEEGLISSEEDFTVKDELGRYATGWNYYADGRIQQIFRTIEGAMTFS